jgi:uncharacterized protein YndB with AHSA1/START domain
MEIEVSVDIAASPQKVWDVMYRVEQWPTWSASTTSVEPIGGAPGFSIGSKARIWQPRLPVMIWEVTELDPGHGFIWQTRSGGTVTRAEHWITATDGGSHVVLRVQITGLLEPILRPWLTKITRRNMEIEAQGLKRKSEEGAGH